MLLVRNIFDVLDHNLVNAMHKFLVSLNGIQLFAAIVTKFYPVTSGIDVLNAFMNFDDFWKVGDLTIMCRSTMISL